MSYRTYVDGEQIFYNNFFDKRLIKEIKRQGGIFRSEYCIEDFEIKDFDSFINVVANIDKSDIIKSIKDKSCCLNLTKRYKQYVSENRTVDFYRYLGDCRGFQTLLILIECKEKIITRFDVSAQKFCLEILEGKKILFSAY